MFTSNIFYIRKFKAMLGAATLSMVIYILIHISNAIIIGKLFGEIGISVWGILSPFMSLCVGMSSLITTGTSISYSYKMGQTDAKGAGEVFGQSLLLSAILSLTIFIASNTFFSFYLKNLDVNADLVTTTFEAFHYFKYVFALYPFYFLLSDMVYTDGDTQVCNKAFLSLFFLNIPIAIFASSTIGIAGIGLSTLCATAVSLLILCTHFFKKSNSLKPRIRFTLSNFYYIVKYSIVDASIYLFISIQTFALNIFVISEFGEFYLPILTLIVSIVQLTTIFDGIGQAMTPLVSVYRGEQNDVGERNVMRIAIKAAIMEGILGGIILFLSASAVTDLFNITSPEIHSLSTRALRYLSLSLLATSLLFLFTSYYLVQKKLTLSISISILKDLIVPTFCAFAFSKCLGVVGIGIGIAIAPFLTIAIGALMTKIRFPNLQFPLLLPKSNRKIFSFDFEIEPKNIIETQNQMNKILEENKVSSKIAAKASIFMEEVYMLIYDRNKNRRVFTELTLIIEDKVTLIFRDDGIVFDITDDCNATASFRGFVVKNMMLLQSEKLNITTTSYNRNFVILS